MPLVPKIGSVVFETEIDGPEALMLSVMLEGRVARFTLEPDTAQQFIDLLLSEQTGASLTLGDDLLGTFTATWEETGTLTLNLEVVDRENGVVCGASWDGDDTLEAVDILRKHFGLASTT